MVSITPIKPASSKCTPIQYTLQDVRALIRCNSPDLMPMKRNNFTSAIKRFSDGINLSIHAIAADPTVLSDLIENAHPAASGITERNWGNILSIFKAALNYVGIKIEANRNCEPMSPAWDSLHQKLPEHCYSLSRFFRFLSKHEVSPKDISQEWFDRFSVALRETYLIKHWPDRYRKACVDWNKAAATIPNWPQVTVTVPDNRPDSWVLNWSSFPATLKTEKDAYLEFRKAPHHSNKEIAYDLKPLKPSSLAKAEYSLRQAASLMVKSGMAPDAISDLATMVSPSAFKACLNQLLEINGYEGNSQAWNTMCSLTSVAKTWV